MSAAGSRGAVPLVFALVRVVRPRIEMRGKPEGATPERGLMAVRVRRTTCRTLDA